MQIKNKLYNSTHYQRESYKAKPTHKVPLIIALAGFVGVFLCQYLTFVPEYSSAVGASIPTGSSQGKTLGDITYMQEITPQICANTPKADTAGHNQFILKDGRDKKEYYVARLEDDNCWMTQNLALNLWDEKNNLPVRLTTNNETFTGSDTDWTSATGPSATWSSLGKNDIKYYNPNPTENADHVATGNYYSFNAATAGSGSAVTSNGKNAEESICPANWQLPTSNNTQPGSFGGLLMTTPLVAQLSPYYFTANGVVLTGGVLYANAGHYWSSTARDESNAYNLYFDADNIYSSEKNVRYIGMSVRCVSPSNGLPPEEKPSVSLTNPTISVSVQPTLTLTIPTTEVNIDASTGGIATGTFSTIVSSNTSYNLFLSAEQPNLINPQSPKDSIPSINSTIGEEVVGGRSGWGIRYCPEDDTSCLPPTNSTTSTTSSTTTQDNDSTATNPSTSSTQNNDNNTTTTTINPTSNHKYTGITKDLTNFYTSNTGTLSKTNLFEVGIGVSPTLPSGSYGTTVTVTASQK